MVGADTYAGRALADDLRTAGFDLEVARRGRDALASARARPPEAMVGFLAPTGWVRAAARDPALSRIPVVGVFPNAASGTRGRDTDLGFPAFFTFFVPGRWDRTVPPGDVYVPGAAAAAVRGAIAAGPRAPVTGRERLGFAMCHAGTVLVLIAFAAFLWELGETFRGARPAVQMAMIYPYAAAQVCGDLGARFALGLPARIGRFTWWFVVLAAIGIVLNVLARPTGGAP